MFFVVGVVTISVSSTRTGTAQRLFYNSTASEWISGGTVGTITDWFSVGITQSAHTTRVGFARVFRFDTATDSVGAFQKTRQASAFSKSVIENCTLGVGSAR